jgi:RimJ/RimL family protein N-acetyltransferase
VNGDEEVTRFLPYVTWRSLADAQAWFKRMAAIQERGEAHQFVAVDKQSARAVGTCLLFRHEASSARAELGFVLAREHWGKGYMREALAAVIDAAFGAMELRRIEAEVDPRNTRSGGLLQRLGFTREGLARERWINHGQPIDVELYGLLRHEWPAVRPERALRGATPPAR